MQEQEVARLQAHITDLQAELQRERQRADLCERELQQLWAVYHSSKSPEQPLQEGAEALLGHTLHHSSGYEQQQHEEQQQAHSGAESVAAAANCTCAATGQQLSNTEADHSLAATAAEALHVCTVAAAKGSRLAPFTAAPIQQALVADMDPLDGLIQAAVAAGQQEQQHHEIMQQVLLPMHQLHEQQQQQALQRSNSGSRPPSRLSNSADDTVTISRAEYELLLLKETAMDAVKEGITIADCSQADMPLIYINMGFCRITGYSQAEVLGKNCRFLQVGGDYAILREDNGKHLECMTLASKHTILSQQLHT